MNVPDCLIFGCFGGGDSLGCIHTAYIGPVENCGTPRHAKLHVEELGKWKGYHCKEWNHFAITKVGDGHGGLQILAS